MLKGNKLVTIILGGTVVLAAAIGLLAISETASASASIEDLMPSNQIASSVVTEISADPDDINHRGGKRPQMLPREGAATLDLLAEALGISVEELQTAQENAQQAALDQALSEGLITQEQYDMMVLRGFSGRGGIRVPKGESQIDMNVLLADELNISVEELQAAREEAADMAIAQAVEDGRITQEQADMMAARKALQAYIDMDSLMEQSLGLTLEELKAAREDGKTISDILAEQGMTASELRDAYEAAYQAAVQQAVDDGVITAEQGEIFQEGFHGLPLMGGFGTRRAPRDFQGRNQSEEFPEAPMTETGSDL